MAGVSAMDTVFLCGAGLMLLCLTLALRLPKPAPAPVLAGFRLSGQDA